MSSGKVVLGLLAGVAAGALLGILFAPDKGSKTRRQILDKSGDYADELKSKFDEVIDTITQKFVQTKEEAEEMAAKGKSKYDDVKKDVKNAASEAKHTMSGNTYS